MSVIKVNKIESTGTTAGGVEVDSSGHVTVDGVQMPTAGVLSNRNLIINGACQVAQRATQVTGLTTGGYHATDRFYQSLNFGTWTVDQSTDAPNGFSKSHKLTCTTAKASLAATDYGSVTYVLEAQSIQHLKYGTSAAESLTVSFWVKSNKTGGASVDMWQPDTGTTRQISNSYTINSADTWEYKTITFPGDASGQINDDNGPGLYFNFWFNSGSNYNSGSLQTTWGALDQTSRNVSNLGVGGAANDYFQITGMQLEVGEKATPFEHRSISDELARCQRYFLKLPSETGYYLPMTTNGYTRMSLTFPTTMRAAPTCTATGWNLNGTTYTLQGYYATAGNTTMPETTVSAEL